MANSLSLRCNRSEFKSRLHSKSGCDLGKSHNLSVLQFPYLKKQWPPPKEQTKPVTYKEIDEPSLTPQKEAGEVLNSLMVPQSMLRCLDGVSETLGGLCTCEGMLCQKVKDPARIPPLSPTFPHWVYLASKLRSPGRP